MQLFRGATRLSLTAASLVVLILVSSCLEPVRPQPDPRIDPAAIMKTVKYLASPELCGRLPGTAGYDMAAEYVASGFRQLGLEPAGDDGGYMQRFRVERNDLSDGCLFSVVEASDIAPDLQPGIDYACRGFSGSGSFDAGVVFAGYGLSLPDRGYDDYAGLDVAGKVVLVCKGSPSWKLDEEEWGARGLPRAKAQAAARHGAVGMLMFSGVTAGRSRPIGSLLHGEGEHNPSFPQIHISLETAATLLSGTASTPSGIMSAIDRDRKPASTALDSVVHVDVRADYEKRAVTENVLAILPGSDPELRGEYLIIGAHLDHVGRQGREVFYPGANDNASGSAVLLAVAGEFAGAETRPARSILFALFASEEQGLYGARQLAENLPVPVEQVQAMFNLDCVGCGDGEIEIGCGKAFPELYRLASRVDDALDGRMSGDTWYGGGADAQPFFEIGIPTLYFHTGCYGNLHRMTDTPDTLDAELMTAVARLVHGVAAEVAGGGYRREERAAKEE